MPIDDMDLPSRTPAAAAPEGAVAGTPEELEVALEDGDPGAILRLARKAELSLDAEYDVFGAAERTRPFHLIAGLGGTPGAVALVEKQARAVDERDSSRRTPLMFACCGPDLRPWDGEGRRAGSAGTVKKLLALGADVHARDEQGETALHYAAQVGAVACVKALLAAGADLATNQHGRTPLDLARQHGQTEVVALLRKLTPEVR